MISSLKSSRGFITLTVTLIIIILVTILSLMTGRMLMNEQRSSSNNVRYKEAINSAQAGLDAALAKLSVDNEYRASFSSTSSVPFYQVSFGEDTTIQVGAVNLPVVSITAVGTSGYSASAANSTNAESQVTLREQAIVGRVVSGTPDAPLVVAAGMAAGGSFDVGANPNGGGAGVPLSIWSEKSVTVSGNAMTCGLQEYYANSGCSNKDTSYSNVDTHGSDILDEDTAFPDNLLEYVFGVSTIEQLVQRLNSLGRSVSSDCASLGPSSAGLYIVHGNCSPPNNVESIGTPDDPIVLVIWDGDLSLNGNVNIYGIVFVHSSGATTPTIQLTGGATVFGSLIADEFINNSAGTYNAVYDAEVLKNIEQGSRFSYIAKVSGSWRDW